jgi:multidrug efflux system outer membrane protein
LGGTNWTAPILQGSALRAQLDAANAAKTAALVSYEKSVLTAFREVGDALVSLQRLREERTHGEQQVASLGRAVDIALSQFRGGTVTYLDVVSAQESAFSAELSLAQLEGQHLGQFVQLYRALGGGWWLATPTP